MTKIETLENAMLGAAVVLISPRTRCDEARLGQALPSNISLSKKTAPPVIRQLSA
jgi:hypothetical protein